MNSRSIPYLVISGVAIALIGSILALLNRSHCAACEIAVNSVGMGYLRYIGVPFYCILIGILLSKKKALLVNCAIFAAAGVHLTLVLLLLRYHAFCFPCLLTAFGAFLAAGAVFAAGNGKHTSSTKWLPIAAVASVGLVLVSEKLREREQVHQVNALLNELRVQNAPQAGTVRLIVYSRQNCRYCAQFDKVVLPFVISRFGEKVKVEHDPAPKGLPTPTLILIGPGEWHFVGVPAKDELLDAIQQMLLQAETNRLAPK